MSQIRITEHLPKHHRYSEILSDDSFPYLIVILELEETKREERMVWPLLKVLSIPS